MVWGANTDVGKTLLSALLCRSLTLNDTRGPSSSSSATMPLVHYIKPVQTGFPADSDARFVARFAPATHRTHVMHTFRDAVSPHRAAAAEGRSLSDAQLVADLEHELGKTEAIARASGFAHSGRGWAIVETAGGVLSPGCSGATQADIYRPLRLPAVLIGDPHLGGIATTLSAAESLLARGYDLDAVLLFSGDHANHAILPRHLPATTAVLAIPPPPPRITSDPDADAVVLEEYFAAVAAAEGQDAVRVLEDAHARRMDVSRTMARRAADVVWYPFTQHATAGPPQVVDSAYADDYLVHEPVSSSAWGRDKGGATRLTDAPASWWTQTLGHGNPALSRAAAAAAARYGHVIAPDTAHAPMVDLAIAVRNTLVPTNMRADGRVFYSDNGSTATEVALKMALQWTAKQAGDLDDAPSNQENGPRRPRHRRILGTMGSYHGDTMGAMDACAPSVFNTSVPWYAPKGAWIDPPSMRWTQGQLVVTIPASWDPVWGARDVERIDTDPLAAIYAQHARALLTRDARENPDAPLGALIIEPVIQGAGGMVWVDPLFHRVLVREVRRGDWNPERTNVPAESGAPRAEGMDTSSGGWAGDIPVIYDEVFTGCWRLGPASVSHWLEPPDIVCYAKSLTGGVLPLAVTCTTSAIFDTFLGDDKLSALLHGHSYTANPVACAVALATFSEMAALPTYDRDTHTVTSVWDSKDGRAAVTALSRVPGIRGVVAMGTVLAIEVAPLGGNVDEAGYNAAGHTAAAVHAITTGARTRGGVFLRSLGNVVYVMASHTTPPAHLLETVAIVGAEVARATSSPAHTSMSAAAPPLHIPIV
ncbi:pyridoxal phosphate-dependent transferase [Blastocladiella britannica]|nr:pyridoxal phosphate-dependent transferase [Blastocladiella britannica]